MPTTRGRSGQIAFSPIARDARGIEVIAAVRAALAVSDRVLDLPSVSTAELAVIAATERLPADVAFPAGAIEDSRELCLSKSHNLGQREFAF